MFYQLKPSKKGPRVTVYMFRDGKQVALPRKLTKHLDGLPEPEIEDWIRWYAAVHSVKLRQSRLDMGEYEKVLKGFLDHLADKGRNNRTIAMYDYFIRFALPTFKDEPSPNGWYLLGGRLTADLRAAGLSASQRSRTQQAFQAFYRWLQGQNVVQHRHGFILDKIDLGRRFTPLKTVLRPDEVLAWADAQACPTLRFIALAGYFFSLRTGEVFGCRKSDFLAGKMAKVLEDSRVLRDAGLDGSLVINIRNCRRPNGQFYEPTARKKGGVVACFDRKAAEGILKLLNKPIDDLIISKYQPNYWCKRWAKEGIPSVTIKDLRRASLYYLGHHTSLPFVGLMNHARHTNPETTALYTRRPEEVFDDVVDVLDLDA